VTTVLNQSYTDGAAGSMNLNGDLLSSAGSISFAGGKVAVQKNLSITADVINFNGSHSSVTTPNASVLALVPRSPRCGHAVSARSPYAGPLYGEVHRQRCGRKQRPSHSKGVGVHTRCHRRSGRGRAPAQRHWAWVTAAVAAVELMTSAVIDRFFLHRSYRGELMLPALESRSPFRFMLPAAPSV